MINLAPSQQPLSLRGAQKREVRTQFAVLAYRREPHSKGRKTKLCLVTSRGVGRWIVPKGWPMRGVSPAEAVAREAWEEAGVEGRVLSTPVGLFSYQKHMDDSSLPIIAVVYAMEVTRIHKSWPEAHERKRKWMLPEKAAKRLSDPELRRIVSGFDPANLAAQDQ